VNVDEEKDGLRQAEDGARLKADAKEGGGERAAPEHGQPQEFVGHVVCDVSKETTGRETRWSMDEGGPFPVGQAWFDNSMDF